MATTLNYYLNTSNVPTVCSYFDQATPGTGPPGMVHGKAPSTEFEKFNGSFNYSLKSKSAKSSTLRAPTSTRYFCLQSNARS